MGLRVQSNIPALAGNRSLSAATSEVQGSMEKLSSGFRINRAADDAAGLAISEKMKSDLRSLNMAKRNSNDGISMLQTAEGAMNEIGNMLARLRELSVQGSSDTIGNTERDFINREYTALKQEIDRISYSTTYNGTFLLIGNEIMEGLPQEVKDHSSRFPLEVQVGKDWHTSLDSIEKAEGGFKANPVNTIRLNFSDIDTTANGLGLGNYADESAESTGTYMEGGTSLQSKQRAQQSIEKIDDAIVKMASYRADIGALQNRLTTTIDNLGVQIENYSSANSRIRDTEYGEQTAHFTKSNIIQQAATSMLMQANQFPAMALKLIG
jgi:flagellin